MRIGPWHVARLCSTPASGSTLHGTIQAPRALGTGRHPPPATWGWAKGWVPRRWRPRDNTLPRCQTSQGRGSAQSSKSKDLGLPPGCYSQAVGVHLASSHTLGAQSSPVQTDTAVCKPHIVIPARGRSECTLKSSCEGQDRALGDPVTSLHRPAPQQNPGLPTLGPGSGCWNTWNPLGPGPSPQVDP